MSDTLTEQDRELVIKRTFDAPRDLVWKCWTTPELAMHWWGPIEYPANYIDMDFRVGGKWRACLHGRDDNKDLWQGGVIHEIEPPRRLAYTFAEGPDGATEVEFRLKEEAGDKVRLTLTHSKIPNRAYALDVSGGWHAHLAILVEKANGRDPDGFWDVWRRYDGIYDKRYA